MIEVKPKNRFRALLGLALTQALSLAEQASRQGSAAELRHSPPFNPFMITDPGTMHILVDPAGRLSLDQLIRYTLTRLPRPPRMCLVVSADTQASSEGLSETVIRVYACKRSRPQGSIWIQRYRAHGRFSPFRIEGRLECLGYVSNVLLEHAGEFPGAEIRVGRSVAEAVALAEEDGDDLGELGGDLTEGFDVQELPEHFASGESATAG